MPTVLNVLESLLSATTLQVFAGCGGMHMSGTGSFGNTTAGMKTLAAVEIEEVPAATYAHNFPHVNVINMGITRFLATARRLIALKVSTHPSRESSTQQSEQWQGEGQDSGPCGGGEGEGGGHGDQRGQRHEGADGAGEEGEHQVPPGQRQRHGRPVPGLAGAAMAVVQGEPNPISMHNTGSPPPPPPPPPHAC
eukprot:2454191-Pyramimonas_sp.AAC.1